MREFECELAGRSLQLAATFKASIQIAEKVADPLWIAREASIEAMMLERGLASYEPKFRFTVENVPLVLHIGLKAAGSSMSLEEVQEIVFDAGFGASRDAALEYLGLIVGPKPEEDLSGEKESEGN